MVEDKDIKLKITEKKLMLKFRFVVFVVVNMCMIDTYYINLSDLKYFLSVKHLFSMGLYIAVFFFETRQILEHSGSEVRKAIFFMLDWECLATAPQITQHFPHRGGHAGGSAMGR